MNLTEFDDDDIATSFLNQPICDEVLRNPTDATLATFYVLRYASVAIGVPGNILSAIVWLRRSGAGKMSSAVYLVALLINNLAHLVALTILIFGDHLSICEEHPWLCHDIFYILQSTATLEPLLVLSFSIERLIAVLRPLQVCLSALRISSSSVLCRSAERSAVPQTPWHSERPFFTPRLPTLVA